MILTEPSRDENGCIVGSFFTGQALAAGILTPGQIMNKYNLTQSDLERIKWQLYRMRVLDALFHFPEGPRYDLLLRLVATSR